MSNVATLASFNKLKASLGLGSVTTVSAYTDFLVQAFVLVTVPVHVASAKRRSVAPKKVYAVDTGLANRVSLSFSRNVGALTENMVFLELLRRSADVSCYRTASGRQRELAAMTEALEEQDLDVGLVLTEDDREDIVASKRMIKVRPLVGWLCGVEE